MATRGAFRPLTKLAVAPPTQVSFHCSPRRFLSSVRKPNLLQATRAATQPLIPRSTAQTIFRRSYADALPPKPKRRIRGFFRWTWRLAYLSAIAGAGYLSYNIYLLRTPSEQDAPDPTKKTLVVLGMPFCQRCSGTPLTVSQAPAGEPSPSSRN